MKLPLPTCLGDLIILFFSRCLQFTTQLNHWWLKVHPCAKATRQLYYFGVISGYPKWSLFLIYLKCHHVIDICTWCWTHVLKPHERNVVISSWGDVCKWCSSCMFSNHTIKHQLMKKRLVLSSWWALWLNIIMVVNGYSSVDHHRR